MNDNKKTLIFFSIFLTLVTLGIIDRFVLPLILTDSISKNKNAHHSPEEFLYPPNSTFHHSTSEFSYTIKINSLGFRDREWNAEKESPKLTVLAIGDSFTFGWGVNIEESWPKLIEKYFVSAGYDVEIANLGRSGGTPETYAKTARRAIKTLKPDLIILGTLQGDDLSQLIIRKPTAVIEKESGLSFKSSLKAITNSLLPNTYMLMKKRKYNRPIGQIWRGQARFILASFDEEEKRRYHALDKSIQDKFMNGDLNPYLIGKAVRNPQYFRQIFDTENPLILEGLRKFENYYSQIRNMAYKAGAKVVVVSIPNAIFTTETEMHNCKNLGFSIIEEMTTTYLPDRLIQRISQNLDIPFFSVTKDFRAFAEKTPLFFQYDYHFNRRGHEIFAKLFFPLLRSCVVSKNGATTWSENCSVNKLTRNDS